MMYVVTSSVGGGGGFVIVKSSESTPTMAQRRKDRSPQQRTKLQREKFVSDFAELSVRCDL